MASPNEIITWSLGGNGTTDHGGTAVAMEWDTANMIDHGGYDQFSGSFPWPPIAPVVVARPNPYPSNWAPGVELTQGIDPVAAMHLPRFARQGAVVTGTRKSGKIVWKGVISQPPYIQDGRAVVKAEGWKVLIERGTDRITYQVADATQWSQYHEQPFGHAIGGSYNLPSKGDSLGFTAIGGTTYATGHKAGYGIYFANQSIVRCKFTFRSNTSDSIQDIRVLGTQDFGGDTLISTIACTTADGTAKDIDVAGSGTFNTLYAEIRANGAGTPPSDHKFWLDDLRVSCVTTANSFTGSDVASDLAGRLGYTDLTTGGATNLLPFDSTGSWADAMDHAASCEDYCWLVVDDPRNRNPAALYFRPYGNRVWRTSMQQLADVNLEPQPLYNRWTTNFERPRGVPHHITSRPEDFGITDPLRGSALPFPWPEPDTLEHPQRSTNLALTLNRLGLQRMTKYRLQGSCTVNALHGPGVPFDMWAGDLLVIGDFLPPVGAQRIANINYNADGTATVNLDRYFDLEDTLRKARHRVRKHRR